LIKQEFALTNDEKYINRCIYLNKKLLTTTTYESAYHNLSHHENYFVSRLNTPEITELKTPIKNINYIDLFCGCGGFALGVKEAFKMLGLRSTCLYAIDVDKSCLISHKSNIRSAHYELKNIEEIIDYDIDPTCKFNDFLFPPVISNNDLSDLKDSIDLVIASPPCQGHSGLNNRTRRTDEKNLLYFQPIAAAIALNAPMIIIENVKGVLNSTVDVVNISKKILNKHNYHIDDFVLESEYYGVSQSRKRHFLIASKFGIFDRKKQTEELKLNPIPIKKLFSSMKTINDNPNKAYTDLAVLSELNKARVEYLFDNDVYELPNHQRPDCHKDGHSYPGVYGRMDPDQVSTTITSGFYSPGRGRFVHPYERRALNAREASQIQGIPDHFWLKDKATIESKTSFAKLIGDAVPPPLVFPIIASLFRP